MRTLLILLELGLLAISSIVYGQLFNGPGGTAQVKISSFPFAVANTQHLNTIVWTMLGRTARETIYCVSEAPVGQLRFVCVDCVQKNITDMVNLLNSAQDLTRTAGFPTVTLSNVDANPAWSGATIICQAAINGGTIDSAPATVDVRYLRQVHVVDLNGQGPVLIPNQGYHFYVECVRGLDGLCQQTPRRKTLHCGVQAHPPASTFRWLKNGGIISGNGPEITIGTEMIGQSIQCSANNGLFGDDMPTSQAVFIDPYSAARIVQDNLQTLQTAAPFLSNTNRIEMNQRVAMTCTVEGNPRPVVFWKLRKSNGQVVDATCPQGLNSQYRELAPTAQQFIAAQQPNLIRLQAVCDLQITNYSFSGQYWCSACSYVSQGYPECSPSLENPGDHILSMQVQGAPMQSDTYPSVEQYDNQNTGTVLVHYCAEPMPKPPREVVFSIDGNDIQIGQSWENFHFEGTTQNNTVPSCYFARLRLSSIRDDDTSRIVILKLQNTYGSKQINVALADLLGVGSTDLGSFPTWLVVLFAVMTAGILLVVMIIMCMKWRVLCFDHVKDGQDQYSNDKLKVHDSYSDETPRGLFGAGTGGPGENPYDAAVHSAFCDSKISSV